MAAAFQLVSDYQPAGDQPKAIAELMTGFDDGKKVQVLLGATGTGKTFTASNIIQRIGKPTLVLAHNKTLAAQLYKEFKNFFPHNAVNFFVSYYDYYQPEAYIPQRDIYIEKDASINENIDRLRLAATAALVSREDVIIVASVSCIYGLGSPSEYKRMVVYLPKGEVINRDELLLKLIDIQYQRNDIEFQRGKFRVRGDTIDVWPASEEVAFRIELFGDEVEALSVIHTVTGEVIKTLDELYVYPAKHFVTSEERVKVAADGIEQELAMRLEQFKTEGKLLEAERLKALRCRAGASTDQDRQNFPSVRRAWLQTQVSSMLLSTGGRVTQSCARPVRSVLSVKPLGRPTASNACNIQTLGITFTALW